MLHENSLSKRQFLRNKQSLSINSDELSWFGEKHATEKTAEEHKELLVSVIVETT